MNKVFVKHHNRTVPNFNPDDYITIFTDASWCPDTKAMGWAGWAKCSLGRFTSGGSAMARSSNEAELHGLVCMIKFMQENISFAGKKVVIQCDCLGALEKLDTSIIKSAVSIKLKHVKGHQGNSDKRSAVNEHCDREARKFMLDKRNQVLIYNATKHLSGQS